MSEKLEERYFKIVSIVHEAALVGFIASMPISIAFCQVSLAIGWIAWFTMCLLKKRWLGFKTSLDLWFLIFLLISVAASVASPKPLESIMGLKKFYLLSAVYLVSFSIKSKERLLELLHIFIIMSSLAGFYGLVVYAAEGKGKLIATQSMAMTSGGIFMLASLLSLPILFMSLKTKTKKGMFIKGLTSGILMMSLFLTKTISSWLGFLSGLVILNVKRWRYALIATIIIIICLTSSYLVYSKLFFNFLTYDKIESLRVRLLMWETAWKMLKDRPILGWGLVDLAEIAKGYRTQDDLLKRGYIAFGHMHNNFIHIAVTIGSLGLLSFCCLWVAVMRQVARAERNADPENKNLIRSIAAGILAFLINGLAEWNFGDSEVITIIWFLVGILLSAQHYGYLASNINK